MILKTIFHSATQPAGVVQLEPAKSVRTGPSAEGGSLQCIILSLLFSPIMHRTDVLASDWSAVQARLFLLRVYLSQKS